MQQDISAASIDSTAIRGLSESEVISLRQEGKGNNIKFKTSRSYKEIIKENLFTFFNIVLFILGALLALLGKPSEAVITSGVVIINVIIAVIQEINAKQKLDKIALLTRPKARVIRDGNEKEIDPSGIVLGDVLVIGPGDQIPVDGHIIGDGKIDVNESLLTGEPDLIHKEAGDQVLSGSFCVTGRASYLADKVGADSYAYKITEGARTFTRKYTPLQREINLIIRILVAIIIFFGILLVIRALLESIPFLESVRIAAVLFGLAPSSLFLMIVVAYALGAVRLANKGALTQQANSLESLANVTDLCLDKTGTITTGKIKMESVKSLEEGRNEEQVKEILGDFSRSVTAGNPTSDAISGGCIGNKRQFVQEVPFSSARKWSALSFDDDELKGVYVLGAPEILKDMLEPGSYRQEEVKESASKGLRVLLLAYRPEVGSILDENENPVLPENLIPLAMITFSDELRPNVKEILQGFADAGIRLRIISGDNPATVEALARKAGLGKDGQELTLISGPELTEMTRGQFVQAARDTDIFGRITPGQKRKLVEALQEQGHYVAMTGDGVNDVMALKQADLGIAMQSGAQATRNVAGIVLLNDSLGVLPYAFSEGQRILNGMKDIFTLYMTRILYLAMLIFSIAVINAGFPFTPKQSSIISILTLSIPCFCLALWARPAPVPRGSLTRRIMHFVIPAVTMLTIGGLFVYLFFLTTSFMEDNILDNFDLEYAQHTLTYFTVLFGLLLIIFVEPPTEAWTGGDDLSGDWRPTIMAVGMFIIYLVFLIRPSLRHFYGLILLKSPVDYMVIIAAVILSAYTLQFVWKNNLVDRYLEVNLKGE